MQDLGQKIRMVVMAHRRIRLLSSVTEEDVETTVAAATAAAIEHVPNAPLSPQPSTEPSHTIENKDKNLKSSDTAGNINGIFTVETENVIHLEYETTDEIKALTQEVIKTIRDIIVSTTALFKRF